MLKNIPVDEITVSLFRDAYPREMMDQLKAQGFTIDECHPGVYQITGPGFFLTQIVVTSRLNPESHAVLRVLSNHALQADVETFIRASKAFVKSGDFQRVDAILQVSASANQALFRRIREEDAEMCQALREIMKEDFEQAEEKGESRLGSLMTKLFSLGRDEDAKRCAADPDYRQKLYKEFKMVGACSN